MVPKVEILECRAAPGTITPAFAPGDPLFSRPDVQGVVAAAFAAVAAAVLDADATVLLQSFHRPLSLDSPAASAGVLPGGGAVSVNDALSLDGVRRVATHELLHVLGVGEPAGAWGGLVRDGYFVGPAAVARYGGPVPLAGPGEGQGHLAATITDGGVHPVMNPYGGGAMTPLDLALLRDLGYRTAPIPPPVLWAAAAEGHVKTFDVSGREFASFIPYPGYRGEVAVHAGGGLLVTEADNHHVKVFAGGREAASYVGRPPAAPDDRGYGVLAGAGSVRLVPPGGVVEDVTPFEGYRGTPGVG